MKPRKILSIAHSYVVALNRRLAHELSRVSEHPCDVTVVAPTQFQGDLRPIALEALPGEPCEIVGVPAHLTGRIHVFFYGRALRKLLAQPWDLVHCWEEPYIFAGRQVAWWTPRQTPIVYATAQNIAKRYPPPFNWVERGCLERAAGWVSYGQTVEETLRNRAGYRDRPGRIIPLGVDVDHFHPDPTAGKAVRAAIGWPTPGAPVVGYLGRFVAEKGVRLLMQVLDRLPCPWRALFVGGGPLEAELRAWAQRHDQRVRICTGVNHDQVPDYLNAMDVLCAPSQTAPRWREQFGRMLIEAFACGVPVVGSDSGEIPHVIGDAGLVVGEADATGWRSALSELLESPSRRQDLAERGLTRARTHFAWSVVARQYLEFFEEIWQSRSCNSPVDSLASV